MPDMVYLQNKAVSSLNGLSGIRVTAECVELEYEDKGVVRLGKDGVM
jgi:hypothetical protein